MYKSTAKPFQDLPNEEWRDVVSYNGYYEVSNFGRIRSLCNSDKAGLRKREYPHLRKLKVGKDRRLRIRLGFAGVHKDKMWLVHLLVAQAFVPGFKEGLQINHKDGNPANNNINNLEWVTGSANIIHAEKTGLFKHRVRGKRVWCSKLNENDVREILKSIRTQAELAIVYKVSQHAIWSIRSGKTWNHVTGLPLNRINKSSL